MMPLVLGAVEIHTIIGITVLVITVLGWIINFIQGNDPDGKPRSPAQKKPQTARSEIEALLSELTGDKRKPKPEQKEQPPRPAKPQSERPRSKPKTAPQRPGGPPPYTQSRPANRPMEAKLPMANLGDGVRTSQLGNQIEASVQKDIVAAVQTDLSSRPSVTSPERPAHPLIKLLRDPNGARQAILLSEILQRRGPSRRP